MANKKKIDRNLDIYEDEILRGPQELVDELLDEEKSPYDISKEFMSEVQAQIEQDDLISKGEDDIVTPALTKAQILSNNPRGVLNINIKPGSPLSNAISDPTENDNLLAVIRDNKPPNTILKAIMEEIAEEAAYIKAWRNENWNSGQDISEATFKRIKMLKHLVETVIEQEKLKKNSVIGKVDFHGESFQRVLKHFLETIQKTFRKVHIPEQFEDIFFTELAKSFDNFEKSAERIYYGKD
jgi:hypothetical protein